MNIKPLRVRCRASEMRFPLRFTHDYRTFDLNLYLVSEGGGDPTGVPAGCHQVARDARALTSMRGGLKEYIGKSGDTLAWKVMIRGANREFKTAGLEEDPGLP